ncbi:hypothetical protein Tco_1547401 [Tanacetum coccineum]
MGGVVHNMFHVSNLKKCYADEPLAVPLDGLHIDDKLHFVEELVEIMDCEVKRLKQIHILIIKVRWNSRRGPEFTWECEDKLQEKYPHLFTKTASSSSANLMLDSEDAYSHLLRDVSSPVFEDLLNIGFPLVDCPGPDTHLQHRVFLSYIPRVIWPAGRIGVFPAEEQPLPVVVSPTTDSPGYIAESDPKEDEKDPEEDPTDYPADGGDDDDDNDESSNDDEDDDDSFDVYETKDERGGAPSFWRGLNPYPPFSRVTARMSIREQPPTPFWSESEIARLLAFHHLHHHHSPYEPSMIQLRAETPSTSHPLLSSTPPSRTPPLLPIPLPTPLPPLLLHSTVCKAGVSEVDIGQPAGRVFVYCSKSDGFLSETAAYCGDKHLRTTVLAQQMEIAGLRAVTTLQSQLGPASGPTQPEIPEEAAKRTTRSTPAATTATTTTVTNAQLKVMIDQGVTHALAAHDADRNMNGDDSHNSGTGFRRTERVARECTYPDFMKCQPLNFKGTEGVVELI